MSINNAINAQQSGFQVQNSSGAWLGRTLTAGTGINITNGDGISGNPTISSTVTSGIVQQVRTSSTTSVSSTKILDPTGTTPTSSNTDLLISLAITPTNASNILIFSFQTSFAFTASADAIFCLFEGTTYKIGEMWSSFDNPNISMNFLHYMAAGTTSNTTYNLRWAQSNHSSTKIRTLQNNSDVVLFNASSNTITQFTITEVTP